MNFRDFKIGWRLLVKEPAYSSVVILGLAVGVAVCYLLLGLVRQSFNYDATTPGAQNIFAVKQHWNVPGAPDSFGMAASIPARDALARSGLPLLASSAISRHVDVRIGERVQGIGVTVVHPEFRQIFSLRPLAGDIAEALGRPDTLALTEESARKLFATTDVVGKTLQIDGKPYRVAALIPTPRAASVVQYDMLAGIETSIWDPEYRKLVTTNWGSSHGPVFVQPGVGATAAQMNAALRTGLRNSPMLASMSPEERASTNGRDVIDFRFGALRDLYLDQDLDWNSPKQAPQALAGLATIAVLILVLAATNYVNLATVRTLRRQREIAMRKVLGASAGRVVQQFLSESVLVCVVATALGLLLAWLLLPAFSAMVDERFDDIFDPLWVAIAAGAAVVLGLLAGAYPAWSALKVRPSAALAGRGNVETSSGLWMRRVLTVSQFATAMGLAALTVAIAWQTEFAARLNPGFDPSQLVVVRTGSDLRDANTSAFRDALARLPGVSGVAVAGAPVTVNQNSTGAHREGGDVQSINWLWVSKNWFEVHGIAPMAGSFYTSEAGDEAENEKESVVINEAAARKLGFASAQEAVGKMLVEQDKARRIIGIAPNLRHRSAREAMQPTLYRLGKRTGTFTVRSDGDLKALQAEIDNLWGRFYPNDVIDMRPAVSYFAQNYEDDLRLAKLLGAASVVAMAIAAFGIYVLAAYNVQRKAREIVLRKLYGARAGDVARLLGKEFMALLGVAALLGLPLAALATERYLSAYVERAPIGVTALGLALMVALCVALASTLRHTVAAMRMAPVLALRD